MGMSANAAMAGDIRPVSFNRDASRLVARIIPTHPSKDAAPQEEINAAAQKQVENAEPAPDTPRHNYNVICHILIFAK